MFTLPPPTNLSKKLGLKANNFLITINQPGNYFDLLSDLPTGVQFIKLDDNVKADSIHLFAHNQEELFLHLNAAKSLLKEKGKFWIFYPNKSSRIRTDLDLNFLRSWAIDTHISTIQITNFDLIWAAMEFRI